MLTLRPGHAETPIKKKGDRRQFVTGASRFCARAHYLWSVEAPDKEAAEGYLRTVDRIAELLYGWCAKQMEDAMCYAKDYRLFNDLKKAEDMQVVQERRAGLIARLLNVANKHGEKAKADKTPIKEVAPAK